MSVCVTCGKSASPSRRGRCHACYQTYLERQQAYGRWESTLVPSGPARAHVLALLEAGVSRKQIARLSGVSLASLRTLLIGKKAVPAATIWRSTEQRLLAVEIPGAARQVAAAGDLTDAFGARRRLQALVASGWSMAALSRECGMGLSGVSGLLGDQEAVTVDKHNRVAAVYERLQLQPGPSSRARNHGRKMRWPLPFQWDEGTIDDPDGLPEVKARRAPSRSRAAA